jgi:tRNA(His) 5'-end guanylyltransferase
MKSFKDYEVYSELRVVPPIIVRVDGVNFKKKLSEYKKPYDERLKNAFVEVAKAIFNSPFTPELIYLFSDELNVYLENLPFRGRIEKINSVVSGLVSSLFTLQMNKEFFFDSRVIPIKKEEVFEYLAWRQNECWRNCLNSYAFYTLLKEGYDPQEAIKTLEGIKSKKLHDILFSKGINIAKVPAWQRRGILIYREEYQKEGYNPITGERVSTKRKKIVVNEEIPLFKNLKNKI